MYSKDTITLKGNYQFYLSQFDLKKGEKVASVGAGSGDQELQMSIFNKGIEWTLQDIDSTALNSKDFKEISLYFENLIKQPINEKFSFVIGNERKTNLPEDTFDKVLVINAYHEITERKTTHFSGCASCFEENWKSHHCRKYGEKERTKAPRLS